VVTELFVSGFSTLAQTRYQAAMEKAVKALMEEQKRWLQQQIVEQKQRIKTQQQQMMAQMMNRLRNQEEQIHNNGESGSDTGFRSNLHFNPKVEFPTFEGIDPEG